MKAFTCLLLFLATWSISTAQGICDPLVPEYCLLPFPNNFFTRAVIFLFFKFLLYWFSKRFFSFSFFLFRTQKQVLVYVL